MATVRSLPPGQLPSTTKSLKELRKLARERFLAGRRAETQYGVRLRQVAQQIDNIVRVFAPQGVLSDPTRLIAMLHRYGIVLTPWAETVAETMLGDVSRRDAAAWGQHGKMLGKALRTEIATAPIGEALRRYKSQQVEAIVSLPRDAATRIHQLSMAAHLTGKRPAEVAEQILASGQVARSKATMLARTGVSSSAFALTRVRALHVGSTGYLWRGAKDARERKSHRAMEGRFVPWDDPPTLDGYTAHCGEFANCRCFPEVALPE